MGGNLRTCDAHKEGHPHNIIDTAKMEIVRVYAERWVPDPQNKGKKVKVSMFVGEQADEGADFCLADFNGILKDRIAPVGGALSWKKVSWDKETVQKKDGSGSYEKLSKRIEEIA